MTMSVETKSVMNYSVKPLIAVVVALDVILKDYFSWTDCELVVINDRR